MNKIFKVIWNPATNTCSVVSETAKSRGKKSGRNKLILSAIIGISGIMSTGEALAVEGLDTGFGYQDPNDPSPGTGWIAIGTEAKASVHTNTKDTIKSGVDNAGSAGGSTALGFYSKATGSWSTAIGGYSDAPAAAAIAVGSNSTASASRAIALGAEATASAKHSMSMGTQALADAERSIAVGTSAASHGVKSVAIGSEAVTVGENSIAMGSLASATGINAIAMGGNAQAQRDNTIAFGDHSAASGVGSVALGHTASASGTSSLAFGEQATASGINSVALGAGSTAQEDDSVSVGNSTTQRKIVYVDKGSVVKNSTDAVNGGQLYDVSKSVADRLGGGASVNTTNGTVNAPSYTITSGTYNNVGDALGAVDSSLTNINTTVEGLSDDSLLWSDVHKAFSAAHGVDATASKITDVAAGDVSAASTDAINGSQLNTTNEAVAQNTNNITQNTTAITNLSSSVTTISDTVTGLTEDALMWNDTASAFSAAHGTNATSKITNVAVGDLSATSTDAVNGSQLYETNQNVANNTLAIETINTSITNLGMDSLSWNETSGSYSASHGNSATNKVTNVAAGALSADSTDAVNGAQLYETNQLITENSEAISNLAGDTSETYITNNGAGVKYIRTNDSSLVADDAHASGAGATAVGYNAVASGAGSLAMGQNSSSSIDTGIALGSGSTSNRAIVVGTQTTSVTSDGVTIGYDTTDRTLLGALSLGTDGESYRQITNVADGTEAQDAVTVRQLQNAVGAVATSSGKYFHANSTLEDSLAVGTDSIAVGPKTVVNGDAGVGIGSGSIVDQTATNGIAIGTNAQASYADSIALGSNSVTTIGAQSGYTAYNLSGTQNSVGEFSVGSATGQRQITNVAAGSADTDAVNVAQLKVTDSKVAENTTNISSLVNKYTNLDTRVTTLENNMGEITVSGGSEYLAVNSTGDAAIAAGAESVAVGASSTASANNSVALGAGSVADEENTVSVGSSSQQRRITNVSAGVNSTDAVNVAQLKASEAGSIRYTTNTDGSVDYSVLSLGDGSGSTTRISNVSAAVNDTDAVNYAQLKQSVESANTYTDQKMGEMNSKIRGVEDKMSGGIASAMAMAGLPQAYAPGASMTSLAGSTYNGETAVALGVSMVSASGSWVYKLQGTSNSQGDYSAAIGAGIQW
jgi:autotransporter adhesin